MHGLREGLQRAFGARCGVDDDGLGMESVDLGGDQLGVGRCKFAVAGAIKGHVCATICEQHDGWRKALLRCHLCKGQRR